MLLGGGRALLLQIAHPLIGEAVYEHSYFREKPLTRLRHTLDLTYTMAFGSRDEVLQAARTINRRHRPVKGALSEEVGQHARGAAYNALDPELGAWVLATLIEGALTLYSRFVGPLNDDMKQAYYDDLKRIGNLLGVSQALLPDTFTGLQDYMNTMITDGHVVVSRRARSMAPYVLSLHKPYLLPGAYPYARLTIALLPPVIREQFGFKLSRTEARLAELFVAGVRRSLPVLPSRLRYISYYHRAQHLLKQHQAALGE